VSTGGSGADGMHFDSDSVSHARPSSSSSSHLQNLQRRHASTEHITKKVKGFSLD
jgi:hypothetical protein